MYTYAFLLNSDQALDLPEGIWGSLELVRVAKLAALVEPDLALESLQQNDRQLMQAVLSHDRVIQDLFQQTAVLPLRFGTYFVSRQGLLDHLQSRQRQYLDKLNYLQGKAEYVLKLIPVSLSGSTVTAELKGRDYFLAKKQLYTNQTEWQQQQHSELQALISLINEHYPEAVRGSETNDGSERFYLLCSQSEQQHLQNQLKQWQQQYHRWQISLGETLPPYHFV
jgi:hypothetical protein